MVQGNGKIGRQALIARASTNVGAYDEAPLPGCEQVAFDGGAMFGSHPRDRCGWGEW